MKEDPGEHTSLAASHPAVFQRLLARVDEIQKTVRAAEQAA